MIVAVAIFRQHVMADLPTNAIPVVIPRRHTAHRDPVAVLHPDTACIIAIQISVIRFVSIQRDVLDGHAGDVLAAEQREEALHLRLAHEPNVLAQSGVELEAIAIAGQERALDYLGSATRHILDSQANPVANLKSVRIRGRGRPAGGRMGTDRVEGY